MAATIELNPYERELMYGYPYVIGRKNGIAIRAPLLFVPVNVTLSGSSTVIEVDDDSARFNSLPFQTEFVTDAQRLILSKLIQEVPPLPLSCTSLTEFCQPIHLDLDVKIDAELDGTLRIPDEPKSGDWLSVVDAAAIFVAPKTDYFIVDDLEKLGDQPVESVQDTVLSNLLGYSNYDQESSSDQKHEALYPFNSNPRQREVARHIDDPKTELVVVQGPPGTGKSLTLANLASHLVAKGKTVLITSQKDKALEVVDGLLRSLELPELPMTLLRRDRQSKTDLIERLEGIQKRRAVAESQIKVEKGEEALRQSQFARDQTVEALSKALQSEHEADLLDRRIKRSRGFSKVKAQVARSIWNTKNSLNRIPSTDKLGTDLSRSSKRKLRSSHNLLRASVEHQVGLAGRSSIRQLRELSAILRRDQRSHKNIGIFNQLKSNPERAHTLLKTLPCWIMTPDDAARLFPLQAGLFDVVIVDEASQCDLPSMVPALYRAKKAVIVGDSRQMQARRFAFTSEQISEQAWAQHRVLQHDPNGFLHPSKTDLLELARIRTDDEVMLNEHYRSMPQIISFSNERWYSNNLRLMRDRKSRRAGPPDAPVTVVHRVENGEVLSGTQENPAEAEALLDTLDGIIENPFYQNASIGIVCLFEGQMRFLIEEVFNRYDAEIREQHDIVVVNPDGFQGDERDVVLYSLSYDAKNMPRQALAARQMNTEHIQGMLNVAFTRARDEIRIFHSAPVDAFDPATGVLKLWLEHCSREQEADLSEPHEDQTDSEFEAEVARALRQRGLEVRTQFPACNYKVDIVASNEFARVAVECDGEIWHLDEHGQLKIEDIDRQEVLERAGWTVLRIPYRNWKRNNAAQVQRVIDALEASQTQDKIEDSLFEDESEEITPQRTISHADLAILNAVKNGATDIEEVLVSARKILNYSRLGPRIRAELMRILNGLERDGWLHVEDGEVFLSEKARTTEFNGTGLTYKPLNTQPSRKPYSQSRRRRSYRR
jgi:very-short-patch-repair endonuclease